MEWKPLEQETGEVMRRKHFAWLPTKVNEWTVWLETYQATYVYDKETGKWTEKERNIVVVSPH